MLYCFVKAQLEAPFHSHSHSFCQQSVRLLLTSCTSCLLFVYLSQLLEFDISNNNLGEKGLGALGGYLGSNGGRVSWIKTLNLREMSTDLFVFFSEGM
jgi:hypothetical protein